MKQYTIKGFADLLITSTQFNNQKTRDKKLLLLDRCNWLISAIIRLHIKTEMNHMVNTLIYNHKY